MKAARAWLAVALAAAAISCAYPRRSTPVAELPRDMSERTDPPPYLWRIVMVGAQVSGRQRSGLPWDEDSDGPDPFVRLFVDGREIWESPVLEDTLQPQWNAHPPRNVLITPSDEVRLEVWDADPINDDPIGIYEGNALSSAPQGADTIVKLEGGDTLVVRKEAPQPLSGLGVELYEVRSDALRIVDVVPHSPAARAGLQAGDLITAIDDRGIDQLGSSKAASALAMAAQRGSRLLVRRDEQYMEVTIDEGYIWPTM